MLLGFKTQLKVNKQQRLLVGQHAGVARHAWNQGLALCQQVLLHNKLHLSQRVFKCDSCGFECDRDLNAAINLKQEAVRLTVLACGLDSADTSRVKQEEKAGSC